MVVRPAPDNYFVRLDVAPAPLPETRPSKRTGRPGFDAQPRHRPRRRKRISGGSFFMTCLAIGLVAWFVWATQQPGGVSGTVNGFIEHVRGDMQDASAGPGLRNASNYFNTEFARNGAYPQPSEDQLTAAGIGIDVDIVNCASNAVVLRTLTVSRLLVDGKDRGEVGGRHGCPTDLADPSPWKSK